MLGVRFAKAYPLTVMFRGEMLELVDSPMWFHVFLRGLIESRWFSTFAVTVGIGTSRGDGFL